MSYNLSGIDLLKVITLISVVCILIRIIVNRKDLTYKFFMKNLIILSFAIYITMVIALTIFPLRFGNPIVIKSYTNFIPLISLIDFNVEVSYQLKNILGNALLLFPLGIYIPIFKTINSKVCSLKQILLTGILATLIIECTQLLTSYFKITGVPRIFDINDIILNTLGVILGYIIYKKILYKFIENFILKSLS
ncbi:MAG: VanZ family protein [Clostridium sp.]